MLVPVSRYSLFIIRAFYLLLIVHLFVHCSIICFAFIFIDSLLILFKREKEQF
jgi:hypothetical protein